MGNKRGALGAFFTIVIVLAALALAGAGVGAVVLTRLNAPPEEAPRPGTGDDTLRLEADGSLFLVVEAGESARSVGRRLAEAGVIRSLLFWQVLSRFRQDYRGEYLKSGSYRLELPASQDAIYSFLVAGEQILVKATIPEGATLSKAARILEEAGVCDAAAFLEAAASPEARRRYGVPGETMEGYLFPDTYFFPLGFPPDRIVEAMADTFFERLEELAPGSRELGPEELNRRVVIASIVEREYRVDEEAALMAGVFYNRLDIGMALQSCATVEYVITEVQGKPHPRVIYTRDTEIQNPYNTYVYRGLPPGPISAPGRVALDAAFHPAATDYLYFRLADADAGRHTFSRTLDEHLQAAALYVKGSGS